MKILRDIGAIVLMCWKTASVLICRPHVGGGSLAPLPISILKQIGYPKSFGPKPS